MKRKLYNTLLVSIFTFTIITLTACRDNKNNNNVNRYDSLSEQERLYNDNADPLNERDQSGGTIENHLDDTDNTTPNVVDTSGSSNITTTNNN